MDADGTKAGFDLELIRAVRAAVAVPVIASGGAGKLAHFAPAIAAGADAVLAASVFHFGDLGIADVKATLRAAGHCGALKSPRRGPPSGAGQRRPDDAGVVVHGSRDHLGVQLLQQRQELVRLPAHPAADDDQLRRGRLSRWPMYAARGPPTAPRRGRALR